jgi:hypothetical protein
MHVRTAALLATLAAGSVCPAPRGAQALGALPIDRPVDTRADLAAPSPNAATAEPWPRVCVHLMLRGGERLSTLADIKAEISRIWRLNGVTVVYPAEDGLCPGPIGSIIRAYLADSPETFPEEARPHVVRRAIGAGQWNGSAPGPVVYAFIERADRLLKRGPRLKSRHLRLSLILGRAIAHEMGHVLLRSAAHSPRGLMRGHYGVVDGWLLPDDHYRLTPTERATVRRNLLESTPIRSPAVASPTRPLI